VTAPAPGYGGGVLVVSRFQVPAAEGEEFRSLARPAVTALAQCRGCEWIRLARAVDDVRVWTLASSWTSVGDYRRALSSYQVKLEAWPLFYRAVDEVSAFEDLLTWSSASGQQEYRTALADDPGSLEPR
jgi:quinol monooxygenase YgiN